VHFVIEELYWHFAGPGTVRFGQGGASAIVSQQTRFNVWQRDCYITLAFLHEESLAGTRLARCDRRALASESRRCARRGSPTVSNSFGVL
jgi:hypothetical protein